jgi:hypothetical protein
MSLPAANDRCPRCGGHRVRGYVQGDAASVPATVFWGTFESTPEERFPGNDLAPLPLARWSESPKFPALHCPACKRIEFEYK